MESNQAGCPGALAHEDEQSPEVVLLSIGNVLADFAMMLSDTGSAPGREMQSDELGGMARMLLDVAARCARLAPPPKEASRVLKLTH